MAKGKDLAAFRQAHDRGYLVKQRIAKAFKTLGDSWEYESEFIRRAGIGNSEWAENRDTFADFIVNVKANYGQIKVNGCIRRAVAGTKAFAAKLRAQLAK